MLLGCHLRRCCCWWMGLVAAAAAAAAPSHVHLQTTHKFQQVASTSRPSCRSTFEECYWTGLRQTRWARAVYAAGLGEALTSGDRQRRSLEPCGHELGNAAAVALPAVLHWAPIGNLPFSPATGACDGHTHWHCQLTCHALIACCCVNPPLPSLCCRAGVRDACRQLRIAPRPLIARLLPKTHCTATLYPLSVAGREYVMPVRDIGRHGYKSDIKVLCK